MRQSILHVGRVKSFSVHYCIARREICIFVVTQLLMFVCALAAMPRHTPSPGRQLGSYLHDTKLSWSLDHYNARRGRAELEARLALDLRRERWPRSLRESLLALAGKNMAFSKIAALLALAVGANAADDDRKNVVKNSGTTVKNKTKKIARSSISYTIYLFFAVFWGCHCIWASASVRGHPREKHLVYVVGAGSRATHCKNAAANGLPLAEKTAKSHSKCHAIGFFGAVSSRSSHRSVGHRLPCGRRRSETKWWSNGP